ncbi:TetR/AcrR family transcriptional regulator [Agromyces cerinus]|uniref:TetR/AcrR family transcriptional regulator n=1 Tax=Agromyces cerinus TaxID=33878 RepID=UPI000940B56A|nr:TetR/AcrR family transcriptional regulator [Agromyces cerinus]
MIDAAQRHLEAGDLTEMSSRDLAAEAGVSHTLVNYHFGSRDALVAAAIGARIAPHDVVSLARDATGTIQTPRLVQGLLAVWEDPILGAKLVETAREYAARGETSGAIAEYLQNVVFAPLVADFGVARGRRMVMTIIGFIYGRYILQVPTLASLSKEEVGKELLALLSA